MSNPLRNGCCNASLAVNLREGSRVNMRSMRSSALSGIWLWERSKVNNNKGYMLTDTPGEVFFETSAIRLLEFECLEVWQFDDLRPISRCGCSTGFAGWEKYHNYLLILSLSLSLSSLPDEFQLANLSVPRKQWSLGEEFSQDAAARRSTQTSSPLASPHTTTLHLLHTLLHNSTITKKFWQIQKMGVLVSLLNLPNPSSCYYTSPHTKNQTRRHTHKTTCPLQDRSVPLPATALEVCTTV